MTGFTDFYSLYDCFLTILTILVIFLRGKITIFNDYYCVHEHMEQLK